MIALIQATSAQEGGTVGFTVPPEGYGLMSFSDGGFMMYPIAFCGLMVLVLSGLAARHVYSDRADEAMPSPTSLDSILFWGAYAVVLGILGTVVGIALAARAVELVGEVHAPLVWGGIRVSLITTIYGLLILAMSGLCWFGLRTQLVKRVPAEAR